MTKSSGTILAGGCRPEGQRAGTGPCTISMVLDRRAFLTTAGMAAGAVALAGRISWSIGLASDTPMDWAADHIFGTYPPYAHPIPFGYQSAPPVSFEVGSFDPHLMI